MGRREWEFSEGGLRWANNQPRLGCKWPKCGQIALSQSFPHSHWHTFRPLAAQLAPDCDPTLRR